MPHFAQTIEDAYASRVSSPAHFGHDIDVFIGLETRIRVESTMAFTAFVPSAHIYYLPRQSPHWRFFWFSLRHPYVVERMGKCMAQCGRVLKIEPESVLFARLLALFEGICRDSY